MKDKDSVINKDENVSEENVSENIENSTDMETPKEKAPEKDWQKEYLYLYAEFENYKKNTLKERQHFRQYGAQNLAKEIISSMDSLEKCLEEAEKLAINDQFQEGIKNTLQHFFSSMDKFGIQKMLTKDQVFDPQFHEALSSVPSDKPEGHILSEIRSGYTIHDLVLRPAQVVVSKGDGD